MIRVLQCEFRKCLKSMAFYICTIVMILVPAVEYMFLAVSSKNTQHTEAAQQLVDSFVAASGDQLFVYFYKLLFNGGSIFVVTTVMAAIIVAEDYSRGTIKYVMLLSSRVKLAIGKVGVLFLLSSFLYSVGTGMAILISKVARDSFYSKYTVEQFQYYVIVGWATIVAFTLLVGILGSLTQNTPATIGVGLGVYMIGAGFGIHLPEKISKFLFILNITKIGSTDINSLFFAAVVSSVSLIMLAVFLWYDIKKKEY